MALATYNVTGSVEALLDAGARLLRPMTEDPEPDRDWDVLTDPEGNEFCVFRSDGWSRPQPATKPPSTTNGTPVT